MSIERPTKVTYYAWIETSTSGKVPERNSWTQPKSMPRCDTFFLVWPVTRVSTATDFSVLASLGRFNCIVLVSAPVKSSNTTSISTFEMIKKLPEESTVGNSPEALILIGSQADFPRGSKRVSLIAAILKSFSREIASLATECFNEPVFTTIFVHEICDVEEGKGEKKKIRNGKKREKEEKCSLDSPRWESCHEKFCVPPAISYTSSANLVDKLNGEFVESCSHELITIIVVIMSSSCLEGFRSPRNREAVKTHGRRSARDKSF